MLQYVYANIIFNNIIEGIVVITKILNISWTIGNSILEYKTEPSYKECLLDAQKLQSNLYSIQLIL